MQPNKRSPTRTQKGATSRTLFASPTKYPADVPLFSPLSQPSHSILGLFFYSLWHFSRVKARTNFAEIHLALTLPHPSRTYFSPRPSPRPNRALFSSSLFFPSILLRLDFFFDEEGERGRRGADRCFLSRQRRRAERRRGAKSSGPLSSQPSEPLNCRFTTQRHV